MIWQIQQVLSVDSEMPFVNEKGNGCQSREIIDGAVASRKRLPKPVSIKDPINNYGNELEKNEIQLTTTNCNPPGLQELGLA